MQLPHLQIKEPAAVKKRPLLCHRKLHCCWWKGKRDSQKETKPKKPSSGSLILIHAIQHTPWRCCFGTSRSLWRHVRLHPRRAVKSLVRRPGKWGRGSGTCTSLATWGPWVCISWRASWTPGCLLKTMSRRKRRGW